jgi:sulfur carrier protein ThiS
MGAVGAVVGVVVLLRSQTSTASGAGATDTQADAAYAGGFGGTGVGTYDSSSTDLSSLLGRYEVNQQTQFAEFQTTLEDALADIGGSSQATPTSIPGWNTRAVKVETISIKDLLKKYGITGNEFRLANPQYYADQPAGYQLKTLPKGQVVNLPTTAKKT